MGKKASVVVFFVTPALERQRQKDPWPPSTFTSASSGPRKRSRRWGGGRIKVGSTSANLLPQHVPTYINAHAPAHTQTHIHMNTWDQPFAILPATWLYPLPCFGPFMANQYLISYEGRRWTPSFSYQRTRPELYPCRKPHSVAYPLEHHQREVLHSAPGTQQ